MQDRVFDDYYQYSKEAAEEAKDSGELAPLRLLSKIVMRYKELMRKILIFNHNSFKEHILIQYFLNFNIKSE
jgi:hypothetical protein